MVNFSPLAAEIVSLVWGTPGNFNGFRVLSTLLQRRRSTEVNQTLHYVWPSPGSACKHVRLLGSLNKYLLAYLLTYYFAFSAKYLCYLKFSSYLQANLRPSANGKCVPTKGQWSILAGKVTVGLASH